MREVLRKLFWKSELILDVVAMFVSIGLTSLFGKLRFYKVSERCYEYCLKLGVNVSEISRQVFDYDIKEQQTPEIVESYKYAYEYFGYDF